MNEDTRKKIRQRLSKLLMELMLLLAFESKLDYDDNYPVLINDKN
mgnify:CR=1 FL=1